MDCHALLSTSGSFWSPPPVLPRPPKQGGPRGRRLRPDISFPTRRRLQGSGAVLSRSLSSSYEGLSAFGGGGEEEEVEEVEEETKGWVHFVGIGGSGLSALAMLALKQGFEVSGSDIGWSSFMDELYRAGARLYIGHSIPNMEMDNGSRLPNAVVISSAIPSNNVEIAHAVSVGIPVYKREVWLKRITEKYNLVAISGTHGKSTTAAMLSYVLNAMGDNLIAVVGANVPQLSSGNIIPGRGPNFVLEADEYDSCFLGLSPYIAVVTNVEWDHVDMFQNEEAVLSTFKRFVNQIRVGGHLILCGERLQQDNPNKVKRDSSLISVLTFGVGAGAGACALLSDTKLGAMASSSMLSASTKTSRGYKTMTYGLSPENDWCASSISPNLLGGQDYVLCYKNCQIARIRLQLPGVHNVLNSLAVIATVVTLLNDENCISDTINIVRDHLSKFEGVSRRFELIGRINGCHIYDDYAHHPTEVRAVLQAARQKFPKQAIWVVFQPHTFSRIAALMNDFSKAFTDADYVIITEIYAAREKHSCESLAKELAALICDPPTDYISELENVIEKLVMALPSVEVQETVVLILGAGDVTSIGPQLLQRLQLRAKA